MRASSPVFPAEGLEFFRELEANNEREWFDAHKSTYTSVIRPAMETIVAAVGSEMLKFAPAYATEPKRAIYRIYRDTRFSANKTPYKPNTSALMFRADLGKNVSSAFYFEISHKYLGIAGGCYMPDADRLRLQRAHMAENYARLDKILHAKALVNTMGPLQGERLSRPPKGFPTDHPAIELLKGKQWYYWLELPAETSTTPALVKEVVSRFKLMTPFIEFLNEPLDQSRKKRAPLETGWI